ncbi:MAG: hypothetical protein ACHQX1_02070 [Candidatus Micrarchaeales archaeon]
MEDEKDKTIDHELKINQLYLAIIARYKEYIEEREHLSIAELPSLVTPKNDLVMKKATEIKNTFGMYNYTENFYEASVDAFYFVKKEIEDIAMPLEFWLKPEETLSFGVGDILDKNILLCTILIVLGNPSAKVLVYVKDSSRKVLTYYELEKKAYLLDFASGFKKFENRDALVKSLGEPEEATCYEFNDKMYIDII